VLMDAGRSSSALRRLRLTRKDGHTQGSRRGESHAPHLEATAEVGGLPEQEGGSRTRPERELRDLRLIVVPGDASIEHTALSISY